MKKEFSACNKKDPSDCGETVSGLRMPHEPGDCGETVSGLRMPQV
jgi:hypothetical protein